MGKTIVKVWANEEGDRAPCLKGDDGKRPAIQEHLAQRETAARDRPYREQRSRDDCTLSAVRGTGARILVRAASAWPVPWRILEHLRGVAKRNSERDWSGAHSYERPQPPRPKTHGLHVALHPPAARRPPPHHDLILCCPGRPQDPVAAVPPGQTAARRPGPVPAGRAASLASPHTLLT